MHAAHHGYDPEKPERGKEMTYGFIGLGNMGGAILRGMVAGGRFSPGSIAGYDVDSEKTKKIAQETGIAVCRTCRETAEKSDVVILAVKPQYLPGVLEELAAADGVEDKLFISIAAGFPKQRIFEMLGGGGVSVVRAMPNLNAAVGEAITAVCEDSMATAEQIETAREVFESVGETVMLPERLIAAFSAVAGASPAFTFMYADALAMAGVRAGIPRDIAQKAALQAVKGSAVNAMQSNEHPDTLRDRVCSPGGTTIEGVAVLEERGFKGAVMDAVKAVIEKDEKMAGSVK